MERCEKIEPQIMKSTNPYSKASGAVRNKSLSVSALILDRGCPVYLDNIFNREVLRV
jgi:hypothetical protein